MKKVYIILTFIITFINYEIIALDKILTICSPKESCRCNESMLGGLKRQNKINCENIDSGELYILSKLVDIINEDREFAKKASYYNISYFSIQNPKFYWSILEHLKNPNQDPLIVVYNTLPLVIKINYLGAQDLVFYFNIDNTGNGSYSKLNTKYTPLISYQEMEYGECHNNITLIKNKEFWNKKNFIINKVN